MAAAASTKLQREDYQVCWICPLPIERTAAEAMLDEKHAAIPNSPLDSNVYTLGRMGKHNIAIAGLPAGNPVAAAVAATHMKYAFPAMRVVLLVGIGGGVPSDRNDVRLGDIVVSYPEGIYGGVVQVDRGSTVPTTVDEDGFEIRGSLNQPPNQLLNVINALRTKHNGLGEFDEPDFMRFLERAIKNTPRLRAQYPGQAEDQLFKSCYDHVLPKSTCKDCCNGSQIIQRRKRKNHEPQIHFELIASANNVRKDGRTREILRRKLNILCFEMEAAGVMNNFACLVIRGVSDYADSHKNDQWQPYAAFTAAAYTKEALTLLPEVEVASWKTVELHDSALLLLSLACFG
jgi:nucleoside phosphorylase